MAHGAAKSIIAPPDLKGCGIRVPHHYILFTGSSDMCFFALSFLSMGCAHKMNMSNKATTLVAFPASHCRMQRSPDVRPDGAATVRFRFRAKHTGVLRAGTLHVVV